MSLVAPKIGDSLPVLVTGASGVFGQSVVRALRSNGWPVVAAFHSDGAGAESLRAQTGCELRRVDVGDEASVAALFASLPPLWGIVHLAGITRDALVVRQTEAAWQQVLQVNLSGAFLVARAALQGGLQTGGRLIFVASRVGERGQIGQGAYASSKAALFGLMRTAAIEGRARDLKINALCPGFVPSPLSHGARPELLLGLQSGANLDSSDSQSAQGNLDALNGIIAWLLASNTRVSGQIIHCDGR